MTNGRISRMVLFSLGSWLWCKRQKHRYREGRGLPEYRRYFDNIIMTIVWAWQMSECDGGAFLTERQSWHLFMLQTWKLRFGTNFFPNVVQYYWLLSWKWKTDGVRWCDGLTQVEGWVNGEKCLIPSAMLAPSYLRLRQEEVVVCCHR